MAVLCQYHQNTMPIASTAAAINTTIRADASIHAAAGTQSAMMNPRRQTCQERTCTPAVKVPSANNVRMESPVALALRIL